ncbi:hypothetical protein J2T58_001584 [Methanocalculus alkaliphilus]|uniref:hypothetical protein n=1 Tax=Methanocalculus alkaliphilus TaxID=768730 RepID=UPI00209D531F|nr:hypothetical protein [Methanocalculus alkaliphilus]MCP1715715.1 hypothetical protein [Methanocalculus alkaliphilus]
MTGQEIINRTYQQGLYTDIHAIEETMDGGFLLGGYAAQDGPESSILIKTDARGGIQWEQLYPGDWIVAIKEGNDTTIYAAGIEWDMGESPGDRITGTSHIMAVDHDGALLWREELSGFSPRRILTTDDGILVAGWLWPSDEDESLVSGFLARYSNDGTLLGGSEYAEMAIVDMIAAPDGGYLLVGGSGSTTDGERIEYGHLTKVDDEGTPQWTETFRNLNIFSIAEMDDGYIMVGSTKPFWTSQGQTRAIGTTDDGTILWEKDLEGYAAYGVVPYGDEFLIVGGTGPKNPLIITMQPDGLVTSSKRFPEADGRFTAVAPLSDGSVAVGGWSRHTGSVEGWLLVLDPTIVPQEPEPAEAAGFTLISAAIGLSGAAIWLRRREGR